MVKDGEDAFEMQLNTCVSAFHTLVCNKHVFNHSCCGCLWTTIMNWTEANQCPHLDSWYILSDTLRRSAVILKWKWSVETGTSSMTLSSVSCVVLLFNNWNDKALIFKTSNFLWNTVCRKKLCIHFIMHIYLFIQYWQTDNGGSLLFWN